jgi:RNA polymerase sigma-70 factor (ECF subfamily)
MFPIEDHSANDRAEAFGIDEARARDALIFGIARGGRDELETLYRQTSPAVYAYALSILKNSSAAEDVMQDTFVSIAQNAAGYRSQGKPMAWIMTITRNLAFMRLQKSENKNVPLDDCAEFSQPQDEYSECDRKLMLKTALAVLSAEERQIVTLHGVSGLKHREIAAMMGIPLSTVLTKYKRALEKMKKTLGGDDGD